MKCTNLMRPHQPDELHQPRRPKRNDFITYLDPTIPGSWAVAKITTLVSRRLNYYNILRNDGVELGIYLRPGQSWSLIDQDHELINQEEWMQLENFRTCGVVISKEVSPEGVLKYRARDHQSDNDLPIRIYDASDLEATKVESERKELEEKATKEKVQPRRKVPKRRAIIEAIARRNTMEPEQLKEVNDFELAVRRRAASLVVCPQQQYLREPIARILEEDKREREKNSVIQTVKRWFRGQ